MMTGFLKPALMTLQKLKSPETVAINNKYNFG